MKDIFEISSLQSLCYAYLYTLHNEIQNLILGNLLIFFFNLQITVNPMHTLCNLSDLTPNFRPKLIVNKTQPKLFHKTHNPIL